MMGREKRILLKIQGAVLEFHPIVLIYRAQKKWMMIKSQRSSLIKASKKAMLRREIRKVKIDI